MNNITTLWSDTHRCLPRGLNSKRIPLSYLLIQLLELFLLTFLACKAVVSTLALNSVNLDGFVG